MNETMKDMQQTLNDAEGAVHYPNTEHWLEDR